MYIENHMRGRVGPTSKASNVHGVVDSNNNLFMNMVIDVMRMNHGYVGQCPIVNEEPNAVTTKFFFLSLERF